MNIFQQGKNNKIAYTYTSREVAVPRKVIYVTFRQNKTKNQKQKVQKYDIILFVIYIRCARYILANNRVIK